MFEFLFYPVFAILAFLAVFITVVILVGKFKKDSTKLDLPKDQNDMNNTMAKLEETSKCDYCGSIIQDNITICPSCGAKFNKK